LIENNALDKLKDNMNKSLLNSEIVKEIDYIEKDIGILEDKISKITISNMEQYNDYQKLEDQLTNIITPSQNQIKKIEQKIKDMKKSDIFMKEFGKYQELRQLDNEKNKLIIDKKNTINYIERNVNNQIDMLKNEGFITEDNMLTQKGQIARKIKEIDTISTTNILVSDYLDMLFQQKKLNKILALFTLLCDGKDNDDYEITEEYHDVLKFIRENSNILINRELLYPVLDWYDGKYSRDIVETYNIHEGDLIKSINKIIHLLDDVIQVFMLINKIEYIDIITEIKNKLIGDSTRNIITMESLYLKIV
jgi:superfamily II RNA helicase